MANKDQPRGATPYRRLYQVNEYVAAGAIYPGSFVKQEAGGRVEEASASNALIGVALSYASGAGETVLVADHPDQRFVVQADGADVAAQTDIGLNYNIVATAGNATYQRSNHELDSDTGADTATLPLKLLAIDPRPDNTFGAQVDCVVKINNHQLAGSTGTAGV